jgi:hypothetical protein
MLRLPRRVVPSRAGLGRALPSRAPGVVDHAAQARLAAGQHVRRVASGTSATEDDCFHVHERTSFDRAMPIV